MCVCRRLTEVDNYGEGSNASGQCGRVARADQRFGERHWVNVLAAVRLALTPVRRPWC